MEYFDACINEAGYIFHAFECHFAFVDPFHWTGIDCIHQFTKDYTVFKHFKEIVHIAIGVDWLASYFFHPF